MSTFLIFSWILFSIFVGIIGITRKIGFFGSFIISLLLSPPIGFVFTMVSKDKQTDIMEKQLLKQSGNYQRYSSYKEKGSYKFVILVIILFVMLIGFAAFFIKMYT